MGDRKATSGDECFCRAAHGDLVNGANCRQTLRMQQRSTFERQSRPEELPAKERPPFGERLWQNQLGIALAVALTLAAVVLVLLSRQG